MKIVAKLTLVFLVAVMLLTAVTSYITVQRAYERFAAQQQEAARQVAEQLDDQLARAWQQSGDEGLRRVLRYGGWVDGDVQWVWSEQLTVSTAANRAGGFPPSAAEEIKSIIVRDAQGTRHLVTYYPLSLDAQQSGALAIRRSLANLDARRRETIFLSLSMIGGMALLGTMLVLVVGVRWVARPLELLIEKTERIGCGDFSGPLQVKGTDELSRLATAVNSMCDQLRTQQATIRAESAERIAAMEQLRHADRLKTVGRLAAGIAHEVGTPLNVIAGRAALIAGQKLDLPDVLASAQTIKAEADRITVTIRGLLDFARRRSPQRRRVDLRQLISDTVRLLQTLADKQGVRLHVESGDQPRYASVDASQIQQVLTNLVVNAIQSMPQGGMATLRLDTCRLPCHDSSADSARHYQTVAIEDQGSGISREDLEQVFEPFFTTKDVGEGTGLGLSIAYGIVQEHGGWIDVDSHEGRGSTFVVYLPCGEDRGATRQAPEGGGAATN
jgi:signal transduction histidine kinase